MASSGARWPLLIVCGSAIAVRSVQVGSAYRSLPLQALYCGAEHAIRGFTESVRTELLHEESGIHVTIVETPAVNTLKAHWCTTTLDRHPRPMNKAFQPGVAERAVVWATHACCREIIGGMPSRLAVWADKLVPGLLDRFLVAPSA